VSAPQAAARPRLGGFPHVVGGLSYIPLIGVAFGVVAIVWGLVAHRRGGGKLALIGLGGIAFSAFLYGGLFYLGFVQRGGVYDTLRTRLAETALTSLVQAVEFYKVQTRQYPESLDELRKSLPKQSLVFIYDPTDLKLNGKPREFYYRRAGGDHYYLLGVGPDGLPFTADDILPRIAPAPGGSVGLLIDPRSKPAHPPAD
jgi:hypothetical protein